MNFKQMQVTGAGMRRAIKPVALMKMNLGMDCFSEPIGRQIMA
jgi:hypothetical protein